MLEKLDGAVVVVAGASSGLGLATAKAAHAAGADVVIVARNPERLEAARDAVGGNTRGRALDAADADAVEALFDELGHVDHVASFTGEQPAATVADTTHELYQRALDARVWAARNLCAAGAPRMSEGGSFTFCSGISAWRPRPNRAAGAAATAALESFARGMAVELAPLRVNTVCPGSFDTPVLDRAFGAGKEAALRPYLSALPLGRLGQPDELAHAVLFLMTNGYVTGTVLHVDGGSLLI
ncbi:MAG TPA: SDR family oxidoreductase [Ilumatobacteraceae bacterium]|nr:SDR family oxidoreductase [Ilumatobacteraceae bacterium]